MSRLSRLSTHEPELLKAREAVAGGVPSAEALEALRSLAIRYSEPAYNYFRRLVDEADAEDLRQEFTIRYLEGRYLKMEIGRPGKRYRDYIKAAVRNMARDHQRKQKRKGTSLDAIGLDPSDTDDERPGDGRSFLAEWLENLKSLAWGRLEEIERSSRERPLHTVLEFRVGNPGLRGEEFYSALNEKLGRAHSPERLRGLLKEARDQWHEALVHEVAKTLIRPRREDVQSELADLGYLEPCRKALDRLFPR